MLKIEESENGLSREVAMSGSLSQLMSELTSLTTEVLTECAKQSELDINEFRKRFNKQVKGQLNDDN